MPQKKKTTTPKTKTNLKKTQKTTTKGKKRQIKNSYKPKQNYIYVIVLAVICIIGTFFVTFLILDSIKANEISDLKISYEKELDELTQNYTKLESKYNNLDSIVSDNDVQRFIEFENLAGIWVMTEGNQDFFYKTLILGEEHTVGKGAIEDQNGITQVFWGLFEWEDYLFIWDGIASSTPYLFSYLRDEGTLTLDRWDETAKYTRTTPYDDPIIIQDQI
jgi:hypothetical protein